jgi:hypothetical protein
MGGPVGEMLFKTVIKSIIGQNAATSIRRWGELVAFQFARHRRGFTISDRPFFDEGGYRQFAETIKRSRTYIEYGSGGSTVVASHVVDRLVSVENDSRFQQAVRRRLRTFPRQPAQLQLIDVDIGVTEEWGKPFFTTLTAGRAMRWRRYSTAPWDHFDDGDPDPDTILIDGRFRVACMLYSLLRLSNSSPCVILFDDYGDRPWYAEVERHAGLVSMEGRMAVFRKGAAFDAESCRHAYEAACLDWR